MKNHMPKILVIFLFLFIEKLLTLFIVKHWKFVFLFSFKIERLI
jgi:hypothetical protein